MLYNPATVPANLLERIAMRPDTPSAWQDIAAEYGLYAGDLVEWAAEHWVQEAVTDLRRGMGLSDVVMHQAVETAKMKVAERLVGSSDLDEIKTGLQIYGQHFAPKTAAADLADRPAINIIFQGIAPTPTIDGTAEEVKPSAAPSAHTARRADQDEFRISIEAPATPNQSGDDAQDEASAAPAATADDLLGALDEALSELPDRPVTPVDELTRRASRLSTGPTPAVRRALEAEAKPQFVRDLKVPGFDDVGLGFGG